MTKTNLEFLNEWVYDFLKCQRISGRILEYFVNILSAAVLVQKAAFIAFLQKSC